MKRMTTTTKIRTTIRRTPVQRASAAAQLPRPRPRRLARPDAQGKGKQRQKDTAQGSKKGKGKQKQAGSTDEAVTVKQFWSRAQILAVDDFVEERGLAQQGQLSNKMLAGLCDQVNAVTGVSRNAPANIKQIRKSVKKLRERPGFKNPSPPPTARTGNIRSQRPKQKQTTQAQVESEEEEQEHEGGSEHDSVADASMDDATDAEHQEGSIEGEGRGEDEESGGDREGDA